MQRAGEGRIPEQRKQEVGEGRGYIKQESGDERMEE